MDTAAFANIKNPHRRYQRYSLARLRWAEVIVTLSGSPAGKNYRCSFGSMGVLAQWFLSVGHVHHIIGGENTFFWREFLTGGLMMTRFGRLAKSFDFLPDRKPFMMLIL
jgi:hypothetical protein